MQVRSLSEYEDMVTKMEMIDEYKYLFSDDPSIIVANTFRIRIYKHI